MSLTKEGLTVPKVVTDQFVMDGITFVGVCTTLAEHQGDKLPTAMAVFTALNSVKQQVHKLTTVVENYDDIVITGPLVSPVFAEGNGYEYLNWSVYSLQAVYAATQADNYILIPSVIFPSNGHYLFNIKVTKLDSGQLELKDKDGVTQYVITAPGDYYIDVNIEFSDSTSFRLVADKVAESDVIVVPYLAVHRITDRFYYYLINKIKELASLDGGGYVDKVLFNERLAELHEDLSASIDVVSRFLTDHVEDTDNPHKITPSKINAAEASHSHTPHDIGAASEQHTHSLTELGAAAAEHEHTQYLQEAAVKDLITVGVKKGMDSIQNVAPLIAVLGPLGILPDEFQKIGMSAPIQILFTNQWDPCPTSDYDVMSGMATSNFAPEGGLVVSAFAVKDDTGNRPFGKFVLPSISMTGRARLALHYQLHRKRKLVGYIIHHPGTVFATQWRLYTDFNKLIHVSQRNVLNDHSYQVTLPEPVECNSMSWIFEEATGIDFEINIEPIFGDMSDKEIGISAEPLLFSVPRNGNNMLFSLDVLETMKITPALHLNKLPLYVYLDVAEDGTGSIGTTYVPLEVGIRQEGVPILTDAYDESILVHNTEHDPLTNITHPVFGTLSLDVADDVVPISPLANVYTSKTSWACPTKEATLVQTFNEPTWIHGYVLEWDLDNMTNMPTEWSLTLYGDNDEIMIVDSITAHGERLTIDRKRVRYVGAFDRSFQARRMDLFISTDEGTQLALTSWQPMIAGDFYGIQFNTMIHGNKVVRRLYLGTVAYDDLKERYDIVNQLAIGTVCSLPVNNFHSAVPGKDYVLPNPYSSTEIACSLRVIGGDMNVQPSGYVTAISQSSITVRVYSRHVFALTLSRNW